MKHLKHLFLVLAIAPIFAIAQFENLKNFSPDWVRTTARNAATDAQDAVIFNPAGIVELGQGFHISFGNQTILQNNKQTYTSLLTGKEVERKQNHMNIVFPNLCLAYVKDNWAISAGLYVVGGGGSLDYSDGAFATEKVLLQVPSNVQSIAEPQLAAAVPTGVAYNVENNATLTAMASGNVCTAIQNPAIKSVYTSTQNVQNQYLKGFSYQLAFPVNFTYKFNDMFSTSVGGRIIYSYGNSDFGTESTVNYNYDYNYNIVVKANQSVTILPDQKQSQAGTQKVTTKVNVDNSGLGFGGIIGINYTPMKNLKFSLTYETIVGLKTKNDTIHNTLNSQVLTDGDETKKDVQPVLRFGTCYKPLDNLTVLFDFNYYFQTQAKCEFKNLANTAYEDYSADMGNTIAVGLGADYKINDKFLVGCGANYYKTMWDDKNKCYTGVSGLSESMSKLDNITIGIGGKYFVTNKISIGISYALTAYFETKIQDQQLAPAYKASNLNGDLTLNNTIHNFAIGVNLKL